LNNIATIESDAIRKIIGIITIMSKLYIAQIDARNIAKKNTTALINCFI